ncbi:MAG: DUF5990 family protein [Fimbriimonas sp.]
MPKLRVTVLDAPTEFGEMEDVRALLQSGDDFIEPVGVEGGDVSFEVPFTLRPDREGVPQPSGPCVRRESDGRRFFYLTWFGTQGGARRSFRRIKVYFASIPDFPGDEDEYSLRVQGRDARGGPACARAQVVP